MAKLGKETPMETATQASVITEGNIPVFDPDRDCDLPDFAWQFKTNMARSNWALPNIGTVYWTYVYELEQGESLIIEGDFPGRTVDGEMQWTRFFSFQTYNAVEIDASGALPAIAAGSSVATIYDAGIQPLDNQPNPYATAASVGDVIKYRVVVSADAESDPAVPVTGDVIAAYPRPYGQKPYGTKGALMLRYYLAVDGYPLEEDAPGKGGVKLPKIIYVKVNGKKRPVVPCPAVLRDALAENQQPGTIETPPTGYQENGPAFVRPDVTDGVYPNAANRYLYAEAVYDADREKRMIKITGKLPLTPKTMPAPYDRRDGDVVLPGAPGHDMRYWSIVINKDEYPYPAVANGGVQDSDVKLSTEGYYTIIVSKPEDRPSWWQDSADSRNEFINWVNWTDDDNIGAENAIGLLFRNLLPAEGFDQSVEAVRPGSSPDEARKAMGEYYPEIEWIAEQDL